MKILCPTFARGLYARIKGKAGAGIDKAGGNTPPAQSVEIPVSIVNMPALPASKGATLWRTGAASVAGSSHERRGCGSDDWFEVAYLGKAVVVVVADGMSSARFGAVGARVACKAVADVIRHRSIVAKTDKQLVSIIREAIGEAQEIIEIVSSELSCTGRDLATTLICAIVTEDFVAAGQIGDCSCVVLREDGTVKTLLPPQKGTYANETFALGVHEEVLKSCVYRASIRGIACFSDGLEGICLNRTEPYWPFLGPVWDFISQTAKGADEELEQLLRSERVRNVTDDDCTLAMAMLSNEEVTNTNE